MTVLWPTRAQGDDHAARVRSWWSTTRGDGARAGRAPAPTRATTEVANSGAEALERFRRAPVDAVLSDLRMEQVDGFDVLAAVHAVDPELPVLS